MNNNLLNMDDGNGFDFTGKKMKDLSKIHRGNPFNIIIILFWMFKISVYILCVSVVFAVGFLIYGIVNKPKPIYFTKNATVKFIKQDDDSEYHLSLVSEEGKVYNYHDARNVEVYYKPIDSAYALIPMVKNCPVFNENCSSGYNRSRNIKVYLPTDYRVPFIVD